MAGQVHVAVAVKVHVYDHDQVNEDLRRRARLSPPSRFHAIARGSAMECGAILDLLHLQTLAEPHVVAEAKSLLVRLVAMLSKMCR